MRSAGPCRRPHDDSRITACPGAAATGATSRATETIIPAIAGPERPAEETVEPKFAGPLRDTVIQRLRDPVDGTICYLYLPISAPHSPITESGFVGEGPA